MTNQQEAMDQQEAMAKVGAVIREATELSILVTLLLALLKAQTNETEKIASPIVDLFARNRGLTQGEAWTVMMQVTEHLAEQPWAYFVLAPATGKSDEDIHHYLHVNPASNRDLELVLKRGLELHSFDHLSKEEIQK